MLTACLLFALGARVVVSQLQDYERFSGTCPEKPDQQPDEWCEVGRLPPGDRDEGDCASKCSSCPYCVGFQFRLSREAGPPPCGLYKKELNTSQIEIMENAKFLCSKHRTRRVTSTLTSTWTTTTASSTITSSTTTVSTTTSTTSTITSTSTTRPPVDYRLTLACTLSLTSGTGTQNPESGLTAQDINRTAHEIKQGLELLLMEQDPDSKALFADTNVTLVIEDDENDAEKVRYWYSKWTSENNDSRAWVYLSPYRKELAVIAAGIVNASGNTIVLPFDTLPTMQMNQQNQTRIISTAVPPGEFLKESLDTLHSLRKEGARTISFIKDSEGYLQEMCDEGAVHAKKQFDVKHSLSWVDTSRTIIDWMSADPDVVVMCVSEGDRISLPLYFEGMKFEPKALVIVNSQNRAFVDALLAPSSYAVIGPEIFQLEEDPCSGDECESFMSRREFVRRFRDEYNDVPSYIAAQAVAAGFFATYAFVHRLKELQPLLREMMNQLSELSQDQVASLQSSVTKTTYPEILSTMVQAKLFESFRLDTADLIPALMNFWHAFRFSNEGILVEPNVTTSQLWKKEKAGETEPEDEWRWKRFTELTPQRIGIQSKAKGIANISDVIFPRPQVREREAVIYPCDPGYIVNYPAFFAERVNDTRNLSRVCQACSVGKYREASSNVCNDCPAGRQATQPGQSSCEMCKPAGNNCSASNATVIAAENYYLASDAGATYLASCLFEKGGRCQGENQCIGNTEGFLCEGCRTGFVKNWYDSVTKPDPCEKCRLAVTKDVVWLIGTIVFWAGLISVLRSLHWRTTLSLGNTTAYLVRSFVSYAQLTAIISAALPLNIPGYRQYTYFLKQIFLDTFHAVPNVCLLGSAWKNYKIKILISLGILPALLILSVVLTLGRVYLCVKEAKETPVGDDPKDDPSFIDRNGRRLRKRLLKHSSSLMKHEIHIHHNMEVLIEKLHSMGWEPAKSSLEMHRGEDSTLETNHHLQDCFVHFKEMACILGFLLYPVLLHSFTLPFPCIEIGPSHLVSEMDKTETCGSAGHSLWRMLGIIGWIVYGLGIPIAFFLLVHSTKQSQFNRENQLSGGFLYGGLRNKHSDLMIISMMLKASLVLVTTIQSPIGRVNFVLILLCLYSVYISWYKPFDARDRHSLAQLEQIMMVANVGISIVSFFRRPETNSALPAFLASDVLTGIVLCALHCWYLYWILWSAMDNAILKQLAHTAFHETGRDNHFQSLPLVNWSMTQWLYKWLHERFRRLHATCIRFNPNTMNISLKDLSREDRRVLRDTMLAAFSKYFQAALTDRVPWQEVEVGKTHMEDDQHDHEAPSKKKRKDIYMGFLSAGMRQAFMLIELSRHLKELDAEEETDISRKLREMYEGKLRGRSSQQDEKALPGRSTTSEEYDALQELLATYGQQEIEVSSEEFYMAVMLCWSEIQNGAKEYYDMRHAHEETKCNNMEKTGKAQIAQWQQEESLEDFLAELAATDAERERQLKESSGDDAHGTEKANLYQRQGETASEEDEDALETHFSVPLPSGSIGASETISRDQGEDDLPPELRILVEAENKRIIKTMGAQNALQVRKEQMEAQEEHTAILQQTLDLQADVQDLERKLVEAEAKLALQSSLQDKRKVDAATLEAIEVLKRPDDPGTYVMPTARHRDFQSRPALGATSSQTGPGSSSALVNASEGSATLKPEPKQLAGQRGTREVGPAGHLLFGTFELAELGQGQGATNFAALEPAAARPAGEVPRT
eukprot:TRINITY_DN11847_c0_g1_i1.p1 TRINITY_DN11847_c0_g1~~TRINITY_DN11847_c0_g1_i1.p1  ORF type:complete len:1744 (+),score=298.12 TRINITY_DN11847_c0_g1_i1:97-5328(+)